jgi:hypothetical protein
MLATMTTVRAARPTWPPIVPANGGGLPMHSPSPSVEVMVVFGDTVLAVEYLSPSGRRAYRVGEGPDVDLAVELDGGGPLELVSFDEAGRFLVHTDGGPVPIGDEVIRVERAGLAFLVRRVDRPVRVGRPRLFGGLSWQSERYTVVSIVGHALLLFLFLAVPPEASSVGAAELNAGSRILPPTEVRARVQPEPPLPESLSSSSAGMRHEGKEGQAGTPKSQNKDGAYAIKRRPNQKVDALRLPPKVDLERQARSLGVLAVLKEQNSTLSTVFSRESALGLHAQDALGHLNGTQLADANGKEGLGLAGSGPGGGCEPGDMHCSRATIGVGTLATVGRVGQGCPGGNCAGYGKIAKGPIGNRTARAPEPLVKVTVSEGGLDKDAIRRVIRQRINEVRYCYERELSTHPDLYGKVVLRMVIAPAGAVAESQVVSSTLKAGATPGCVAQAARRWSFPASPRATIVTYPFVFQSAGK